MLSNRVEWTQQGGVDAGVHHSAHGWQSLKPSLPGPGHHGLPIPARDKIAENEEIQMNGQGTQIYYMHIQSVCEKEECLK